MTDRGCVSIIFGLLFLAFGGCGLFWFIGWKEPFAPLAFVLGWIPFITGVVFIVMAFSRK